MSSEKQPVVDIVIPVYREGDLILSTLRSLRDHVQTTFRVLLCHDDDKDPTLEVVARYRRELPPVIPVKNRGIGALGAVMTGFACSQADIVAMVPADDDYNASLLDAMFARILDGVDIICPSRFMTGGRMEGCPPVKAILVRLVAWFLFHVAGLPTRDATNGFRVFSRKVIRKIHIETSAGFGYSLEYLVKAQRLGWRIEEQPVCWFEREKGKSRFRILAWAPIYLRWVGYALATRYLGCRRVNCRMDGFKPSAACRLGKSS